MSQLNRSLRVSKLNRMNTKKMTSHYTYNNNIHTQNGRCFQTPDTDMPEHVRLLNFVRKKEERMKSNTNQFEAWTWFSLQSDDSSDGSTIVAAMYMYIVL